MKRLFVYIATLLIPFTAPKMIAQEEVKLYDSMLQRTTAKMYAYIPQNVPADERTPAVIILPGGSYFWHDMNAEGRKVAEWLNDNGIAAFVVEYRVAGAMEFVMHTRLLRRGHRHPESLFDVQKALATVRGNAHNYGIDPQKVGVMGFSAGGHLSIMAATMFDRPQFSTFADLRPNFAVALYPVVTLGDSPYTHKRSRRGLLGDRSGKALRDSLSLENLVRADMPPVFLANCKDDPIVKYQNSEILDKALTGKGVSHRYLQFNTGGHGFGADDSKNSAESIVWKREFINWLKDLFK